MKNILFIQQVLSDILMVTVGPRKLCARTPMRGFTRVLKIPRARGQMMVEKRNDPRARGQTIVFINYPRAPSLNDGWGK